MGNETNSALLNIFHYLIPEMVLIGAACVIFLGGTWRPGRHLWAAASVAALVTAGITLLLPTDLPALSDDAAKAATCAAPITHDSLALLIKWIALGSGFLLVLFSWNEVTDAK